MGIALLLLVPALAATPAEGARSPAAAADQASVGLSPYIGAAVGGGNGWVMVGGATNRSLGLSAGVRAGLALRRRFAVDLNGSILTLDQSFRFPQPAPVLAIRLVNVYGAASVFPLDDAFFVRAGVGYGWLSATNGFDAPSASLSANGFAAVAGLGYRFWLSDRLALALEGQGFVNRYGSAAMKADGFTLSIRLDFHFARTRAHAGA